MLPAQNQTEPGRVPGHIAIIMDGNGRWAKRRMLPRAAGHRRGAEAVRKAVMGCVSQGVKFLTLYAFSSENWKRPPEEVDDLMGLLRLYIRQELQELDENGVRVRFIGDRSRLSDDIRRLIEEAEIKTGANAKLTLIIALNYGSHAEIVRAARDIARDVKAGLVDPDDITEDLFSQRLYTEEIPDPDLVIRTSGEKRLSNFLLWQSAYAELIFLDVLWPDFDESSLAGAIQEYQARERRFGART
ncbi:MAG: isoprenyl transferase [Sphingomonadales bacterium]|nr:isoprenyl transferase [Sphingomonadales bacterium]